MTVDTTYLVDVFGAAVEDVRFYYDKENGEKPYYLHGHPLEIIKVLSERDKSKNWKYRKYPLVILLQDFAESKGVNPSWTMQVSPRVLIVNQTKREFSSKQRYDENFKPILYPIYELLLEAIANVGFFGVAASDQIVHTKTDRLFWGREGLYGNESNVFNDYLDAIDITFSDLPILSKENC